MKQQTHPQNPAHKTPLFTSRTVITGISLLVLVGFASALLSRRSAKNSTAVLRSSPTTGAVKQSTPVPAVNRMAIQAPRLNPTPDPLAAKIAAVLPKQTSTPEVQIDRAIDFSSNANVPGKKDVVIYLNRDGTQQDKESTREAAWQAAVVIVQRVFPLDKMIDGVIIDTKVFTRDESGRTTPSLFISISISRKTYNKIDFKHFDYKDIPTVADYYIENTITQLASPAAGRQRN